MGRKRKFKVPFFLILYIVFGVGLLGLGVFGSIQFVKFVKDSSYFKVKSVLTDASLDFIEKKDLTYLKDESMFSIDLEQIERRLRNQYPQLAQLRVIKKFPNRVFVMAKKRVALAQIKVKKKYLTLDEKGVVLASSQKQNKKLPFVSAKKLKHKNYRLGQPFVSKDVMIGLKVIDTFDKNEGLSRHRISNIDVRNLSKIHMILSNDLKVLIDRDRIEQKVGTLSFVLSQGELNVKETKYLDLRFKEPILGKK